MSHIITVTANLLWEETLQVDGWKEGGTHRANQVSFQVGGKGINVSRMLTRLEAANTAALFPGGNPGTECVDWLRKRGIPFRSFVTAHSTRRGFVVRSPGQKETTFFEPDCRLDAAAIRKFCEYLEGTPPGTVLAICGSIPGWESSLFDPLRRLLDTFLTEHPVAVDTYGAPLSWFSERPVSLIKINRDEFNALCQPMDKTEDTAEALASLMLNSPVHRWVITNGAAPVYLAEKGGCPLSADPPPVAKVVSALGSGDVFFAACLHALHNLGKNLYESVQYALPFAAANTASAGVADFALEGLKNPPD